MALVGGAWTPSTLDINPDKIVERLLLRNVGVPVGTGESVWESNPPCRFVAGNIGFEVREGHQNLIRSQWCF